VRLAPWPWSAPLARILHRRYLLFTRGRFLARCRAGRGRGRAPGMVASAAAACRSFSIAAPPPPRWSEGLPWGRMVSIQPLVLFGAQRHVRTPLLFSLIGPGSAGPCRPSTPVEIRQAEVEKSREQWVPLLAILGRAQSISCERS
jgi:hypothetical protein